MNEISYIAALTAGLLSFLSPCVLPLIPAYLSFMTGISVERLKSEGEAGNRETLLLIAWHSLAFILGFSLVFIGLGASATYLGRFLLANMTYLSKIGGVVIILFGLHMMGVLRIPFLYQEARFSSGKAPAGPLGAFVIGFSFAFGWTPCVGPILAGILALAGGQETIGQGIALLAVYSAGLGIPFLLAGLATHRFFAFFSRIRRHFHKIEVGSGLLLIAVGVLIYMGDLTRIASFFLELFPGLATLG